MVRCVCVGWVGVRPGVIRRGRCGALGSVKFGCVMLSCGLAGAVRLGISCCVAIWCVESMYVELRSVAVRYGRQGGLRCCTVGSCWVRSGRPGKLRSVGVSCVHVWFGRLGTFSFGKVR